MNQSLNRIVADKSHRVIVALIGQKVCFTMFALEFNFSTSAKLSPDETNQTSFLKRDFLF